LKRLLAAAVLVTVGMSVTAYAADPVQVFSLSELRADAHKQQRTTLDNRGIPIARTTEAHPCVDGVAGTTEFACDGIDLLSFVPSKDFGGSDPDGVDALGGGNSDLWGWTDPVDGGEYVIMGKTNGVAFFDVTDPKAPRYLGDLPNQSPGQFIWHDIKVFKDHAFITSESVNHGMTIFDLTQLRDVTEPKTFAQTARYLVGPSSTDSFHNLAINEETGFAYLVGGNNALAVPDVCLSGLHMVDITAPKNPRFAGCHATGEGRGTAAGVVGGPASPVSYIHDTQCVVYRGPDADHTGKELCFNSSEDHMSVVDVSNKLRPVQIVKVPYPDVAYAHQGWLTEDGKHFMMGDELDEGDTADRTRTLVFDVEDIDKARYVGANEGATPAIDHNMYVKGGLVYQSNYAAGLRVLDTDDAENAKLPQAAFFDGFPAHDDPEFVGTWSNYPYFPSGTVAFSGIDEGLFLVKVQDAVLQRTAGDQTPPALPPIAVRNLDSACPPGKVPANSHTDDDDNTHERAIECMVWWEIAKGQTSARYAPGAQVSREQMASFIARLIEKAGGTLPAGARNAYSDDDTSVHHDSINKLAAAGLVDGKGDARFAPRETVSRAQMAKFLVNAYEFVSPTTLDGSRNFFADDDGDLLEPFINKSAAAGFTAGRNGGYEPRQPVLRDAMAAFLARDLDLLVNEGTTKPKA
jgi:choice-of-anchor B domain-containing protein